MEPTTEENMSFQSASRKNLLVEYSKILIGHLNTDTKPSAEDTLRMKEIQTSLELDHDSIMLEASEYLSGTVGQ